MKQPMSGCPKARQAILQLLVVFAATTLTGAVFAAAQVEFFVATDGSDGNVGSREKPFATLTRARDAIRQLKANGGLPQGGVTVWVRGGTYYLPAPLELTKDDGGTPELPIVYRAEKRGSAILSGGVALTDWQAVSDSDILKNLNEKAKGNVLWTELGPGLIETVPGFANGGCGFKGKKEYPIALYQRDERLPISRWPNNEYAQMGECLGRSHLAGHAGIQFTDGIFRFDNPRLQPWSHEPEIWFDGLWFHPWADQKMQLKEISLADRTISLKNPESHAFGFKKGQGFYAFNAVSEIDRPGEWAVDRARRRIYLWPAEDPKAVPPVAALREGIVKAEGLSDVTFDGLVFEACRQDAIVLKKCAAVTVVASTVRHTGAWAVNLDGGERGTVIGCDLYDLGEGGVMAVGGDHDTLTPGKHLIENNHVHHFGRIVSTYRPGAAVYGVGNVIRHNLIHHAQHQAIYFNGNDHLIEYNIVHDVCLHTSDAGALYACTRNWSHRGTTIRHNFLHALGEGVDACGCHGIYLDDWTSGSIVYGNIISQADLAVEVGGGSDTIITNNLAVNCRTSVCLSSRGVDSFARKTSELGRASPMYKEILRDLYKNDLWRKRYPAMLAPLDMDPILGHNANGNTIRYNVGAGSGDVRVSNAKFVTKTCAIENNITINGDPGFVDVFALDLGLRPDAPVFAKLPGFKPTEFEKMGLYNDPRRASPAVKFGPDVTPMEPIASPEERDLAKIATVFPVGRATGKIVVDGTVDPQEWTVAETDPSLRRSAAIQWEKSGVQAPFVSRACLAVDEQSLYIGASNDVDPKAGVTHGHTWGKDDGIEVALARTRGPRREDVEQTFVLRGYADGRFESVTDGGASPTDVARLAQGVGYAAKVNGPGNWSAEWRIPLAVLGVQPKDSAFPILTQMTVRRPAGDSWTRWAKRPARSTWSVCGAYALWLMPFGDLAFLPGMKDSVVRIDVSSGRDKVALQAGKGAENPTWAAPGSRILAAFGSASADRWTPCEFEFTPETDGEVVIELMGMLGAPTAWTYYDDLRLEGAELVNGDFEQVGENGLPVGWRLPPPGKGPTQLITNGRLAASGSRMIMASHDFRAMQAIRVAKDRKVTVRFKARGVLGNGETQ